MIFQNRFNDQKRLNFSRDNLFKPELQGLFSKADMVSQISNFEILKIF